MKINPLHDNILATRIDAESTTPSGLHLPASAVRSKLNHLRVVAVGPGIRHANGSITEMSVRPGETILIGNYVGSEIVVNEEKCVFLKMGDVLGVLEDETPF